MDIHDFRLESFKKSKDIIIDEFDKNPFQFQRVVQERVLSELEEWRQLGISEGYFRENPAGNESAQRRRLIEFRKGLTYALDSLERKDIFATGLLFYANDQEWENHLNSLQEFIDMRSMGSVLGEPPLGEKIEFLNRISWMTSAFISEVESGKTKMEGFPSEWRFGLTPLAKSRLTEMKAFTIKCGSLSELVEDEKSREMATALQRGSTTITKFVSKAASDFAVLGRVPVGRSFSRQISVRARANVVKRNKSRLLGHLKSLPSSTVRIIDPLESYFLMELPSSSLTGNRRRKIIESLQLDAKQVKFLSIGISERRISPISIGSDGEEVVHISSPHASELWNIVAQEVKKSSIKVLVIGGEDVDFKISGSSVNLIGAGDEVEIQTLERKVSGIISNYPLIMVTPESL